MVLEIVFPGDDWQLFSSLRRGASPLDASKNSHARAQSMHAGNENSRQFPCRKSLYTAFKENMAVTAPILHTVIFSQSRLRPQLSIISHVKHRSGAMQALERDRRTP
jgi:hypothetical protein